MITFLSPSPGKQQPVYSFEGDSEVEEYELLEVEEASSEEEEEEEERPRKQSRRKEKPVEYEEDDEVQEADEDEGEENSDDVSEEEAERPVKRRRGVILIRGVGAAKRAVKNRLGQAGCVGSTGEAIGSHAMWRAVAR